MDPYKGTTFFPSQRPDPTVHVTIPVSKQKVPPGLFQRFWNFIQPNQGPASGGVNYRNGRTVVQIGQRVQPQIELPYFPPDIETPMPEPSMTGPSIPEPPLAPGTAIFPQPAMPEPLVPEPSMPAPLLPEPPTALPGPATHLVPLDPAPLTTMDPLTVLEPPAIQDPLPLTQPADAVQQIVVQDPKPLMNTVQSTATAGASVLKNLTPLLPFIPPAIPPLAKALKQKERHVYDIEMNLRAASTPQIYQFTLGNKYIARTFAIEVEAGKALQFSKATDVSENYTSPVLFRRRYTTLVVNIEDITDNPSLANGPKIYPIPLSTKEGLLILHQNPYNKEKGQQEIPINLEEITKWATVRKLVLKIAEAKGSNREITQTFPLLPFGAMSLSKANGDFIEISQRPAPTIFAL